MCGVICVICVIAWAHFCWGLASVGVVSTSGFIPGFGPCVLMQHHEYIPLHPLHLGVAARSLC